MTINKSNITYESYAEAARILDVDVHAIIAVAKVESRGDGFLPTGEPVILFEAHWFSKFTGGQYDKSHPSISSKRWNRKLYTRSSNEHNRLQLASSLNREAALKSASWGKFQIMGFNWEYCGYKSLQDFINAMYRSEADHLEAFTNFLFNYKNGTLVKYLRAKNWDRFAYHYNGSGYKQNNYHVKLFNEYNKLIKHAVQ